jgi:dienelactone hydrolase
MRALNWAAVTLAATFVAADLSAQENANPQPPVAGASLELQGLALSEFTDVNARIALSSAQRYIESLRRPDRAIPEQATVQMAAAQKALDRRDNYRAFRLSARAAALATGRDKLESFEIAASLQMFLNRAIFAGGETITLTLRPMFSLGHPLAERYAVHAWLETQSGTVAGTERKIEITELRQYRFDFPTDPLKDGIVAVGYRLTSTTGETLAEFRRAVLVARDVPDRLQRLKASLAAVEQRSASGRSPARVSALDTVQYNVQNLELERTRFEWGFQREFQPLAVYLSVKAAPENNTWAGFPEFRGRIRYPQDLDLAESLAGALGADPQAVMKLPGDRSLAYRSSAGELIRYRLFVPSGYDGSKEYSLIVALHSGEGDSFYFDHEDVFAYAGKPGPQLPNRFKTLAQERDYIVAVPNGGQEWGFAGKRGEADVTDLAERVRSVYSIESRRVFLTGWSGGAAASWNIGIHNPGSFGGVAPVGNGATWLTPENIKEARDLPVLYSIAGTEVENGRRTAALARDLLRNFTYREFPDTEHASVWYAALPVVFDFFDKQRAATAPGQPQ